MFSVKGPMVDTFGLAGRTVFVATTRPCRDSMKAPVDNTYKQMDGDCIFFFFFKCYLQRPAAGGMWPPGHSLQPPVPASRARLTGHECSVQSVT